MLEIIFTIVTAITIIGFYYVSNKNWRTVLVLLGLGAIQALLAKSGFFENSTAMPPRMIFAVLPSLVIIVVLFNTQKGKVFIDGLDTVKITYLHTVRVPVELCILGFYLAGLAPVKMTFEGYNFDVLSGLTAPLIAYFGYQKGKIGKGGLLAWNVTCMALLLIIVVMATLSIPSPIQQLSFDQPNIAVIQYPYIWLPGIIVPVMFFGHLVAVRKLLQDKA